MADSLLMRLRESFQNKREDSWWKRVQENARAFLAPHGAKPCAIGSVGAFDLIDAGPAPGTRNRQALSLVVHGIVIAAIVLLGKTVASPPLFKPVPIPTGKIFSALPPLFQAEKAGSGNGPGGSNDPRPPNAGDFAHLSQTVLLHPHVPDKQEHILPVEPTVFDAIAQDARQIRELGLPTMKDQTLSNGPGPGKGIGLVGGNNMGDRDGPTEGESDYNGMPVPGMSQVKCLYCPDPEYTDEARHEKLQGSVTLRVLVTKDGRAGQVKIIKGLGLGLDERAINAVRSWRFQPARDASKNPIAQWVTVETTYRLF